jgi:hypothetical protein
MRIFIKNHSSKPEQHLKHLTIPYKLKNQPNRGKILKQKRKTNYTKKTKPTATVNKHPSRQIPQRTQKNIFFSSREISSSSQSSTDFPYDFFQDLLFSTWRTSMSKLISGVPKIINNSSINQTTKQKMQRFLSPTFTAKLQNIIPYNRRLVNSASEHAEFPNSEAKTTLKEKMITSLHTAMTETTLHLTLISHFEQSFPCKKPIFHSKPHNKSMLRNRKGNYCNSCHLSHFNRGSV